MRFSLTTLALLSSFVGVLATPVQDTSLNSKNNGGKDDKGKDEDCKKITPKVMIISMFAPEDVWTTSLKLTTNIPLIGASPMYPNVTCNAAGEICHITTAMGEINAASSMTALLLCPAFDLKTTYFMVAGIAGVNPYYGTLGTATFARFAVQVALAYEIDARQIPANWTTGYFLFGTTEPDKPAAQVYGTEVFELNTNLLKRVMEVTKGVKLNDTADAAAYRKNYNYAPANQPPTIVQCDTATSDVYWAGSILGEAFGNITKLFTNNQGNYCTTQQEDNAHCETLIRAAKAGLVDFSRIIILRTAADFDRAPPNQDTVTSFLYPQGGFPPSITNLFLAGNPVVTDILINWKSLYKAGIAPQANFSANADNIHTLTMKRRNGGGDGVLGMGMRGRGRWEGMFGQGY